MELLSLEQFIHYLEPYANKETLNLIEASKLQLLITELLVDYYVDFRLLKFISRFITQQSYDEIIEERNIEHQCGYITCDQSPKQMVRRRSSGGNSINNGNGIGFTYDTVDTSYQYQIYNRKPTMILPNTYLSQYCCKEHYQASIFYRNQLNNEAIFTRKDIMIIPPFSNTVGWWYENSITCLEEVIAKHKELKQQGKSLSEVVAMMSGLSVDDTTRHDQDDSTNQLVQMIQDFEIVEKESNLIGDVVPEEPEEEEEKTETPASEGYVTNSTSFGGYVV
ncbi:RNA polymerase II subunit B1 CTD phosphatase RTR1 [Spathaspora sp. JA1]|nr:RNA polymerase II subunit B1 CTD phosphatase RTR1 [Spathaspora sp. JA1]